MLYFLHDCKAASHISDDLSKKFLSCIQVNTVCTSLFIAEGGDPPSMLNILGLVRKPSTDESSLDRAPSDSEGLPDSKTEQLQPAEISEPIRQENIEVLTSEFTGQCKWEGSVLTLSFCIVFHKHSSGTKRIHNMKYLIFKFCSFIRCILNYVVIVVVVVVVPFNVVAFQFF